jgi:hypothetical protein
MKSRIINNVAEKSFAFEWQGEKYTLKYSIYVDIKFNELYPGGIHALAAELKRVKDSGAGTQSVMMLLEVFAIMLNQQITIHNIERREDLPLVTAEYLLAASTSTEQVNEMMMITYQALLAGLPGGKSSNAAEDELDELAGAEDAEAKN